MILSTNFRTEIYRSTFKLTTSEVFKHRKTFYTYSLQNSLGSNLSEILSLPTLMQHKHLQSSCSLWPLFTLVYLHKLERALHHEEGLWCSGASCERSLLVSFVHTAKGRRAGQPTDARLTSVNVSPLGGVHCAPETRPQGRRPALCAAGSCVAACSLLCGWSYAYYGRLSARCWLEVFDNGFSIKNVVLTYYSVCHAVIRLVTHTQDKI